ncbi:MAG: M23 family metallopeptidase [Wenzhouxiangellaceae bacterium]
MRNGWLILPLVAALMVASSGHAEMLRLEGSITQGGMIRGKVPPHSQVSYDGEPLQVSSAGDFVFGFGRDDAAEHELLVILPDGGRIRRLLQPDPRAYKIEHVDGVPQETVEPPAHVLKRIRREAALVSQARQRRDTRVDWAPAFIWPAKGRISGVYGSQRVLNGKPSRPHYGVDVAAPVGTPVVAPADGVVTLAEDDLFYSGGTIIIDHGHGVSSSFLHLSEVAVTVGQTILQGERIGAIGATGRASGPHLDWRMNWHNQRIDPQLLVPYDPEAMAATRPEHLLLSEHALE